MSAISVRLPNSLHEAARRLARAEDVSVNQFITLALAEKISALTTQEYFATRGGRADASRFRAALEKVPDVETNEPAG
jgi:predicted transcriptional regulator